MLSVVTVILCVSQWPGVPQVGPDDRGLREPFEEDDGGICSTWKGRTFNSQWCTSFFVSVVFPKALSSVNADSY